MSLSYRRADVAGLWTMSAVTAAALAALAAGAAGLRAPWAWGVAVAVALVAPGLVRPEWFSFGVKAWNRAARSAASALRWYVLRVSYYTLFAAVGRTSSRLNLSAPAGPTAWVRRSRRRGTQPSHVVTPLDTRWLDELRTAVANRRDGWMFSLFPVMFLLNLLRDERQESAPPSSTYTLY